MEKRAAVISLVVCLVATTILLILVLIGISVKTESEQAEVARPEYSDLVLLETARTASKLVSETVKDGYEYNIYFGVRDSNGATSLIRQTRLAWNNGYKWRSYCEEQILNEILWSEKAKKAHRNGGTLEVTDVTLEYVIHREDGSIWYIDTVSDFQNDGEWDDKRHVC